MSQLNNNQQLPQSQAQQQPATKKIIVYSKQEIESADAPPIDFSFKNITDISGKKINGFI